MKIATIRFSTLRDETKISFSSEFKTADWLLKLDILKDAINDLEYHYVNILKLDWQARNDYDFTNFESENLK
jgi:hypothetical protein